MSNDKTKVNSPKTELTEAAKEAKDIAVVAESVASEAKEEIAKMAAEEKPKRKAGRPKMTEEQKAAAKKAREEKTAKKPVAKKPKTSKKKDTTKKETAAVAVFAEIPADSELMKQVKEEAAKAKSTTQSTTKKPRKAAPTKEKGGDKIAQTTYVQFFGNEYSAEEISEKAKEAFKAEHKRTPIQELKLYIKPEENAAYFVVNDKFAGKVDI